MIDIFSEVGVFFHRYLESSLSRFLPFSVSAPLSLNYNEKKNIRLKTKIYTGNLLSFTDNKHHSVFPTEWLMYEHTK